MLLALTILRDGSVRAIRIERSSGHSRLDQAALAVVRDWRYRPATRAGKAIDFDYLQPIEFRLR